MASEKSTKRSLSVSAGLLASLALSLTGCGTNNGHRDEARRCVNDQNVVINDSNCNGSGSGTGHWYYGGSGFGPGSRVSGGSPNASKSSIYSDGGSVSRGGIGETGGGGGHGSAGS
jgi:hypothetical protein